MRLKQFLFSQVGKKYLIGASGLLLVGFMVSHLLANLLLYLPQSDGYNLYVYKLHSFGPLLTAAELGLAGLFVFHIVMALWVTKANKQARPVKYAGGYRTKGGPSRASLSSSNMIITGIVLMAFLILHIIQMRFGPGIEEGYVALVNGETSRDLYRWVDEVFQNPVWVGIYSAVILFFGLHIRHGFWSAFQSLGAAHPKYSNFINLLAVGIAIIMTVGFFFIPMWMYFDLGGLLS
jgi:succinate dehydrogenase / fumarate reductase cytochrome b subunit